MIVYVISFLTVHFRSIIQAYEWWDMTILCDVYFDVIYICDSKLGLTFLGLEFSDSSLEFLIRFSKTWVAGKWSCLNFLKLVMLCSVSSIP